MSAFEMRQLRVEMEFCRAAKCPVMGLRCSEPDTGAPLDGSAVHLPLAIDLSRDGRMRLQQVAPSEIAM